MFGTMREAGLYPPRFVTRPLIPREAVLVVLRNQNQPTTWEQVSHYVDQHGSISNLEVREILRTDDRIRASRQLKEWVDLGLLVVTDPRSAKSFGGTRSRNSIQNGVYLQTRPANKLSRSHNRKLDHQLSTSLIAFHPPTPLPGRSCQ